jgi:predicted nucleotidyltransferase
LCVFSPAHFCGCWKPTVSFIATAKTSYTTGTLYERPAEWSKNTPKKHLTKGFERDTMINVDINSILATLVSSLKSSDPYKIILFGSYAKGNPNANSDIDIMVILDNNHVSKTYNERLDKKIFIRSLVLEINRKIPIDILVYSREELNKIKEYGNYFIDEIEKTGKIIYEKTS